MKPVRRAISSLHDMMKHHLNVDFRSLQFRMAAGVTLMSVLGIIGVSGWMSVRTQQILMGSQKQHVFDLADRLPEDVATYDDMMATEDAIQRAIELRSLPDVSIVVSDLQGDILAQSQSPWHDASLLSGAMQMASLSLQPNGFQINGQNYVGCRRPLVVDGEPLGTLYIALNVTESSQMFAKLMWSLGGATVVAIALITVAIVLYVRQSVQPLRKISQVTADLSVDDLDHVNFHLGNAPTEVKELAQTCETTLQRLADALTQQRQFVRDISHELRTPLTVVYGYLQSLLRRGHNLTDLQREAIDSAASEAERTIRLLQDLLDLARAESGHFQFNPTILNLNEVLREAIALIQPSSGHSIELDTTEPAIYGVADADRLKQVILNLIENAIRYSAPDQPVTVRLSQSGESAIIQVCDRGSGIPPEHQALIFNRCYRVDETRSRSTGGYGLGLTIVKTLVEGMNGTIHLDSAPNRGSTFTITLPLPHENNHDSENCAGRRRRQARSLY